MTGTFHIKGGVFLFNRDIEQMDIKKTKLFLGISPIPRANTAIMTVSSDMLFYRLFIASIPKLISCKSLNINSMVGYG